MNAEIRDKTTIGEAVSSGEFEAVNPLGESPWSANKVVIGGAAVLEDGSLNTARFSGGITTDLTLPRWNRKVLWESMSEPSGHQVLVARISRNVWTRHIQVAGGIVAVATLGTMVTGALPVMWALVLGVILMTLAAGAVGLEQRLHQESPDSVIAMDRISWNAVVSQARANILTNTEDGQKKLYKNAVELEREGWTKKYADPVTGEVGKTYIENGQIVAVPKYKPSTQLAERFLNPDTRLSADAAESKILKLLEPANVARIDKVVRGRYEKDQSKALARGLGVSECECQACIFNAEHDLTPTMTGAEARLQNEVKTARARRAAGIDDETEEVSMLRAQVLKRLRGEVSAPVVETLDSGPIPVEAPAPVEVAPEPAPVPDVITDAVPPKRSKNWGSRLVIFGAVVVSLLLVGMAVLLTRGGGEPAPAITVPTQESVSPTTSAQPTQEKAPTAGEVAGKPIEFDFDNPGNRTSGAGTIAAYDFAYYNLRDAKSLPGFYVPGAEDSDPKSVAVLQAAIERNPSGTRHKLVVTPVVPGSEYDVQLTVLQPNRPPFDAKQKFFVTYLDGKFWILRAENL